MNDEPLTPREESLIEDYSLELTLQAAEAEANKFPPKPCPLCKSSMVNINFLARGRVTAINCLGCGITLVRHNERAARRDWNRRPEEDDRPRELK